MTWQANFTVQDVGDGPAPVDVLAVGDVVLQQAGRPIVSAVLRLQMDEAVPSLKVGDAFTVTSHFPD